MLHQISNGCYNCKRKYWGGFLRLRGKCNLFNIDVVPYGICEHFIIDENAQKYISERIQSVSAALKKIMNIK